MSQNKQNQIKITFIQSPINQVTGNLEFIDQTLQNNTVNQQINNFELISKRLSQKIKKIQQNQIKNNSTKRFNNFRQIKNNIISKDPQTIKFDIQNRLNNIREKSNKIKSKKEGISSKEKNPVLKQDQVSRRLFQEQVLRYQHPSTVKSQNSLLNCLNEVREVKKTIKSIKQRCKNGPIEPMRKQKMQNYYLQSNSAKKRYISHSGSKYNYTNYHDLSQKKLIQLSERRQKSERQFNWIANPIGVNQFTIITGQEPRKCNLSFTLQ